MLVVLIAFAWGRRNIACLYRHLDESRWTHRTRFNNFVNVARGNPQEALARKAHELLGRLTPRKGEVVELILDDSKKEKRGEHVEAVGWTHDPLSGGSMRGHQYVKATLRFRGHTIPLGTHLYIKKEQCPALVTVTFKGTSFFSPPWRATCVSPPQRPTPERRQPEGRAATGSARSSQPMTLTSTIRDLPGGALTAPGSFGKQHVVVR